jgi:FG-GAP-like repeat
MRLPARATLVLCAALEALLLPAPARGQEPRFVDPRLGVADFDWVDDLYDADGDGDLDGFAEGVFFENVGTPLEPRFAAPVPEPAAPGLAARGARITNVNWDDTGPTVPATADLDGDGRSDALVVDGISGAVSFRRNLQTDAAPLYEDRLRAVPGLWAPFAFGDLDGDGDLDAFGYEGYFENVGRPGRPAFAWRLANPFDLCCRRFALGDLDADGDLDAVVGDDNGHLHFRENPGRHRVFSWRQSQRFRFADVDSYAHPALADLDGDGDLDLLVGAGDGTLALFENVGTTRRAAFAGPVVGGFGLLDVGQNASPAVGDLDGDGDVDVLVGRREGEVVLFENVGAPGAIAFAPPRVVPELTVAWAAVPALVDADRDGDLDCFVGDANGDTSYFENAGTAAEPAFAAGSLDPFGLSNVGDAALPLFADMDGDGDADAFVQTRYFENVGQGSSCPASPDPACLTGFERASLAIREDRPGRERHQLALRRGPALDAPQLGHPLDPGGSSYALCLYDDADHLALERQVDRAGASCGRAPCWRHLHGTGYRLRDPSAPWDGATSVVLRSGAGGSRVTWLARNRSASRSPAFHTRVAPALAETTRVTAQVRVSDGACLSATLSDLARAENRVLLAH